MHGAYRRKFGPESLAELSQNMIIQHEDYLKQDEPDRKQDALRYMAGYATQYLHLVPQEKKFTFKETERVLHNSAMNIADFDPREGSLAFMNLAKYAENLLEQPWRKDFHIIKLTSGFYVHNISAQLQNAHEILIVMGYVNINETTLQLLPNLNYGTLKAVSRDCYIASQECLILSQIWQHVADQEPDYPLTIGEVFEYRKNHLGDTDTICNKLLFDIRQRMHLVKQQQQQQMKYQQQQLPPVMPPMKASQQQRFVPVDRLIDYGLEDVDEPDMLPSRSFAPEREVNVDRAQDLLKSMNIHAYQDDEHIYDPVYGSNTEMSSPPNQFQHPKQRTRPSDVTAGAFGMGIPQNYHGVEPNLYSRKSMPVTAGHNPYYQQQQVPLQHQFHNNNNTNGAHNVMMMYGNPPNQREQSLSPMIPKTVTGLFSSSNTPPNNGVGIPGSRNNVSKSNSMNSLIRGAGAASSSSSSSVSQKQPLTRTKIKETDLDAADFNISDPSHESNLLQYQMNTAAVNPDYRITKSRKSLPVSAFSNNYQSQSSATNNQVYPDEYYPPGIVKPVAVYGASTINPSNSTGQSTLGANFQYYMRARQNSDNSEDVLNEAYAYASEVSQMPKRNSIPRVNSSSATGVAKSQPYQHQATPIPLPQGSDSDSHSGEVKPRELNSGHREMAPPPTASARSGSSTDASSSWEGSILEVDMNGRPHAAPLVPNKLPNRKSEPVRRPTHIEIGGSGNHTRPSQSSNIRYADSSPESDMIQTQQQHQQQRNKNGYRELSSSSSGDSPASTSSFSRNFQRSEELNSLDTVYYDYLLKQGQTDEIMGRDGGNINSSENERDSRERRRSSKSSSHHPNNQGGHESEENHIYDGRRVIPKKKQQNVASASLKKKQNPVESAAHADQYGDPNYNNLTAEATKHSREKIMRKSTNMEQIRERTPVENEFPSSSNSNPVPQPVKKPVEPWDCRHCTFRNHVQEKICEICAKSKDFFEENEPPTPIPEAFPPLQQQHIVTPKLYSVPIIDNVAPQVGASNSGALTGGINTENQEEIECPQCTLLNPIRARVCDACNFRLKPVESPKTLEEAPYDIR